MSATIKDVAKLANTAISTVSRVMNNAPNVTEESRRRVLAAVEKLDYKPNRIAQTLGGHAFSAIGVVSTRASKNAFTNPYFATMLQAIGEVCEHKNFEILLNGTQLEDTEYEKCMSIVDSKVVQGLIFLSSRINSKLIRKLLDMNFPFVVVGNVLDPELSKSIYTVDTDNFTDSKQATEYLIRLGHRVIGCLHAPLEYVVSKERLNGFLEAHKVHFIPVNHTIIADAGYTREDAYLKTLELLSGPVQPTAIFATDDSKALGIYEACKKRNLKIPEDLSVIGHNNYEFSTIISPELTTIDVPIYDLGVLAATHLFKIIHKEETPRRGILPTQLIVRNSCVAK